MRLLGIHVWIEILSYLGCNEWKALIGTCRAMQLMLRPNFLRFVKRFAVSRLRNMLHFLDFDYFTRLMRRENGEIGGSIHIQLLNPDFLAGDIDVFVYGTAKPGFSPLQKYLFSECLNVESLTRKFRHQNVTHIYRDVLTDAHNAVGWPVSPNAIYRTRHLYTVWSIHNYVFVCPPPPWSCECKGKCKRVTIQVVKILEDSKEHFTPMHKLIKHAIGDFSIVQSSFNGKCYNLYGIPDMFEKRLICSTEFRIRTTLFSKPYIKKHEDRVAKYEKRGFRLIEPLPYGEYTFVLFSIPRELCSQNRVALVDIPNFAEVHAKSKRENKAICGDL
jgi:hypothetical protein